MPDTTTIVAATTAISVPVTAVLTLLLTKGVDAWRTYRNTKFSERMETVKYEDTQAGVVYGMLIKGFESRVTFLEDDRKALITKLESSDDAHKDCLVKYESLRGDFKALQAEVNRLTDHDKRNVEHAEVVKVAAVNILNEKAKQEKLRESGEIDLGALNKPAGPIDPLVEKLGPP